MILNEKKLVSELQNTFDSNVFIMMRYRPDAHFVNIEASLKSSLAKYGLIARLAKDCAFSDDLWENIQLYMKSSRFGIAVFEEIDERDFNPNISLELGYMYALERRCLLLKDKRMPRLPTDTCGKIYKDFDTYDLLNSIESQVGDWCERDLGLSVIGTSGQALIEAGKLIYDSQAEDRNFRTWGVYSSTGMFSENIKLIDDNELTSAVGGTPALQIAAMATEGAGVNKAVFTLWGRATFNYKAIQSAKVVNLYFCMIPMQKEIEQLIEVGAELRSDPANAHSPYRVKFYIPHQHIGDDQWHQGELAFDFRNLPTASYSIFGARVNEGSPRPGLGIFLMTNVQIFSYTDSPSDPEIERV